MKLNQVIVVLLSAAIAPTLSFQIGATNVSNPKKILSSPVKKDTTSIGSILVPRVGIGTISWSSDKSE